MTGTPLAEDVVRTRDDILGVSRRIDQHQPEHPTVRGAREAVDWLLGDHVRPLIAPEGLHYVDSSATGQAVYASMVGEGALPGDPVWARGVEGVLAWAAGMDPLPAWLRATPDR